MAPEVSSLVFLVVIDIPLCRTVLGVSCMCPNGSQAYPQAPPVVCCIVISSVHPQHKRLWVCYDRECDGGFAVRSSCVCVSLPVLMPHRLIHRTHPWCVVISYMHPQPKKCYCPVVYEHNKTGYGITALRDCMSNHTPVSMS
jgi:hypothetical protein